ncbi:carotenoid oxygenase family protein, partial [Mycolicibacterium insubricum]|uniref:carotenoid oxygenase family protein n=1 Tax=Mycolicibacterium insubricum TaxID=444597 RepID=UPI002AE96060|nr:carotenoid oxygenase family protein [Mycolicibacterium insubricum]
PTDEDYHWFDGDGMVYAFYIENGRISLRNRWVRTDKFLLEQGGAAGFSAYWATR